MLQSASLKVILFVGLFSLLGCEKKRSPSKLIFPEKADGLFLLIYEDPIAPPLPEDGRSILIDFTKSNTIRTSSSLQDGWAKDQIIAQNFSGVTTGEISMSDFSPDSFGINRKTVGGQTFKFTAYWLGPSAKLSFLKRDDLVVEELEKLAASKVSPE